MTFLDFEHALSPIVSVMGDDAGHNGLTIAQMSELSGVSAHTLRYYERAGLIRPVCRNVSNHRRYAADDVAWVQFLLRLRETGMPIRQMRTYADLRDQGPATTAERLSMLEEHQQALTEQIAQLLSHNQALEAKIAIYRDDLTTDLRDIDAAGEEQDDDQ